MSEKKPAMEERQEEPPAKHDKKLKLNSEKIIAQALNPKIL